METTNIYIRTRQYGGTYLARTIDIKPTVRASCTMGHEQAALACARKLTKPPTEPLRLEPVNGVNKFRAVFPLAHSPLATRPS